jgi:hypothetical protein
MAWWDNDPLAHQGGTAVAEPPSAPASAGNWWEKDAIAPPQEQAQPPAQDAPPDVPAISETSPPPETGEVFDPSEEAPRFGEKVYGSTGKTYRQMSPEERQQAIEVDTYNSEEDPALKQWLMEQSALHDQERQKQREQQPAPKVLKTLKKATALVAQTQQLVNDREATRQAAEYNGNRLYDLKRAADADQEYLQNLAQSAAYYRDNGQTEEYNATAQKYSDQVKEAQASQERLQKLTGTVGEHVQNYNDIQQNKFPALQAEAQANQAEHDKIAQTEPWQFSKDKAVRDQYKEPDGVPTESAIEDLRGKLVSAPAGPERSALHDQYDAAVQARQDWLNTAQSAFKHGLTPEAYQDFRTVRDNLRHEPFYKRFLVETGGIGAEEFKKRWYTLESQWGVKGADEHLQQVQNLIAGTSKALDENPDKLPGEQLLADTTRGLLEVSTVAPTGPAGLSAFFGTNAYLDSLAKAKEEGREGSAMYGPAAASGIINAAMGYGVSRLIPTGVGALTGKGAAEGAIGRALAKIADKYNLNPALTKLLNVGGKSAAGAGAGVFDMVGLETAQYLIDRATYGADYKGPSLAERIKHAAVSGAAMGGAAGAIHGAAEDVQTPLDRKFERGIEEYSKEVDRQREAMQSAVVDVVGPSAQFRITPETNYAKPSFRATPKLKTLKRQPVETQDVAERPEPSPPQSADSASPPPEPPAVLKTLKKKQEVAESETTRRLNAELEQAAQEHSGVEPPPITLKKPPAAEYIPDFVSQHFEPDGPIVRSEQPELTAPEQKKLNREFGALKRRVNRDEMPQEHVDYLESLDPRDRRDILDEAKGRAEEHNSAYADVIEEYKAAVPDSMAKKARLAERRGGDPTYLRTLDTLADSLTESYPNLAAYPQSVGNGDIAQGLFEMMRDGAKGLEEKLRTPDHYLEDAIGHHRDYVEQRQSEEHAYHERLQKESQEEAQAPSSVGAGGHGNASERSGGAEPLREAQAPPVEAPQQVDSFALSRAPSPDTSPVVEPYAPPDSARLPERAPAERQPQLEGMPTDMQPGTLEGQQGLFEKPQTDTREAKRQQAIDAAQNQLGFQITAVEPRSQDHHDAIEYGNQQGKDVVFFTATGNEAPPHGFAPLGGDVVFLNADLKGSALWGILGHELAHAKGFDIRSQAEQKLVDDAFERYWQRSVPEAYRRRLDADPELRRAEGVAQLTQDLFESKDFRRQVKGEQPSFWGRFVKAVKSAIGSFTPKDKFAQEVLAEFGIKPSKTKPAASRQAVGFAFGKNDELFNREPLVTTGTKNAVSEEERRVLGFPERVMPKPETVEDWNARAKSALARDPATGRKLVDELRSYPRQVSAEENMVLLNHKAQLKNQLEAATKAGDTAARNSLLRDYQKTIEATERVGTVWGRGGRARQELISADYSLAGRGARLARANGRELTPEEWKQVETESKQDEQLQLKVDAAQDEAEQKELAGANKASRATFDKLKPRARLGKAVNQAEIVDNIGPDSTAVELSNAARELAKDFIRQGFTDRDVVINKVHDVLQQAVPDLTRRQTMDAISLYGQFSQLNKEPVATRLREIAGESQQIAKLLDMEAGKAPLKTGMERRAPTDEERRLMRLVNEAKKKYNIEPRDPALQLKSALDAVKTRLRNQIRDLDNAIKKNERFVTDRRALPYDAEANDLKSQRDELRAYHDALFGDTKMSDAKRLELAMKAMERASSEAARRIAEKDFARKGPESAPWSPEMSAAKAKLAAQRALLDELKANDPTMKADADLRANYALRRTLADRYAKLSARMSKGDFTREPRKDPRFTVDAKSEAAKKQLATLRAQFDQRVWEIERRRNLLADKADLDQQLKTGEIKIPPDRKLRDKPRDIQELEKQVRERKQIARQAILDGQKTRLQKLPDLWLKIRRAFVLSSPVVFEKLVAAAAVRAAVAPFREAAGGVISAVFPRLAAKAPIEGRFSPRAEARALTEMFTKSGKDAWDTLKTGKSAIDLAAGKASLPPEAWGLLGRLHGSLKTPAKRNAYARALEKGTEWAIRNGLDPTDTAVQLGLVADAYKYAQRSIFLNNNAAVDAYKAMLAVIEAPNKETGRVSTGRKLAATTVRTMLPIVTVPTNIVAETVSHAVGAFTGSVELARAYARGVENLKPAEADAILRNLKNGSLGGAAILLGYFAAGSVGGYYQPGKKDEDGVEYGGARVFGHDVPRAVLHNPLLECLQIGATIRHVSESKLRKHDENEQGLAAGTAAAAFGLIEEVPFVRETLDTGKLFDPRQRASALPRMAGDIAVPQALSQTAKYLDKNSAGETVKRKPTTITEGIKENIPGLRQSVPEAKPPKAAPIAKRTKVRY